MAIFISRFFILGCVFLWVANLTPVRAATSTKQFQEWYPRYRDVFENITDTFCKDQFENYEKGVKDHSKIDFSGGGGIYTVLTQPLIDCILNQTSEFIKGSMTSAQVLLGVMPTILSLLGPSHEELSMLAVVGRRPLLAMILGLASPGAYFSRSFEYSNPKEILSIHKNRHQQNWPERPFLYPFVSLFEYALAVAACCNAITNCQQIGVWSITSFWTDSDFAPLLWLGLGSFIHLVGFFVLRLRMWGWRDESSACERKADEFEERISSRCAISDWFQELFSRIKGIILPVEWTPCASRKFELRIGTFRETKRFLLMAWLESILTVLHIVFGTVLFSGTLFVGVPDALYILGRFLAGVLVCRIILMFEIAGMRKICTRIDGEDLRVTNTSQGSPVVTGNESESSMTTLQAGGLDGVYPAMRHDGEGQLQCRVFR